ncbi:MAG: hypothetical protein IPG59_23475 [Candidatus Melainabacteria bacterium]|nr:MAG: hypothetical protein IPG59_23475 [Candidatus Melainabacteria bacterium]
MSRTSFQPDFMEYTYKPPLITMFLAAAFFTACSFVLFHEASTNDRGLILWHLITFDLQGATNFYWGLFVCSILFVLTGIMGAYRSIANPGKLRLGEHEITFPNGFLGRDLARIQYSQIQDLSEMTTSGQTILTIKTRDKKYSIVQGHLPNKEAYTSVKNKLMLHCT